MSSSVPEAAASGRRTRRGPTGRALAARLVAVLAAVLAVTVGLPATSGGAAPRPSLAQVEHRIAVLNARMDRVVEAYDGARQQVADGRKQAKALQRQLDAQQKATAAAQGRLSTLAAAAYRSEGSPMVSLLTQNNPGTLLNQATALDALSQERGQAVQQLLAAQRSLRSAKSDIDRNLRDQQAATKKFGAARAHIETLLRQQHDLLDQLSGTDRARYDFAQASQAAMAASERNGYTYAHASGSAGAAVRFAYQQLGKPYQYGGAGPDSYDCSGLTMASWRAGGVGLPHNSASQQGQVRSVPLSALQPGDLVFYGSPAYHVAIYVGNGRIIHAPHSGTVVQVSSIDAVGTPSGAGRP